MGGEEDRGGWRFESSLPQLSHQLKKKTNVFNTFSTIENYSNKKPL